MPLRVLLARMRYDSCGGRPRRVELLTGIAWVQRRWRAEPMQSPRQRTIARSLICALAVTAPGGCDQSVDAPREGPRGRSRLWKAGGSRRRGNCRGHDPGAWGTSGGIAARVVAGPSIASMTRIDATVAPAGERPPLIHPRLCQRPRPLDWDKVRGEIAMHHITTTALAALGICALTSCASHPPQPSAAYLGPTEGSITFSGGAIAIGVGFQWGSGTLTYQGRQYPFSLNGLSVVDVGVTRATGSGSVHNLRNVADFSGNYVSIAAGATVAGGGSVMSLRNQNGVVIDGVTTTQGVRLTLAPGGVNITLSGQPSS